MSDNLPKIGVKIPQKIAWTATASPNSVLVEPPDISNSLEYNPKVCLTPIVAQTTKHADSKAYKAVLLGKNGKVLRENSIIISGKNIENADGKTLIIVQKGDALWNIAFQRLGLGNRYIDIVKLNKDKIKNPDLIYPKQLFIIPNKIN